jgi:hypothetical protein
MNAAFGDCVAQTYRAGFVSAFQELFDDVQHGSKRLNVSSLQHIQQGERFVVVVVVVCTHHQGRAEFLLPVEQWRR